MSDLPKSAQQRHEDGVQGFYARNPNLGHRASICLGHNDAAHMCDAIATDILDAAPKRNGPKRREAEAQARALKMAGDAIWALRERIKV